MENDQEQKDTTIKPTKKKTWHKQWTPKQFAKFLMSIDMKYVLPGTSNEMIMEELKDKVHCGIGKVSWLRNHREFQKEVEETFNYRIKSNFSTETMFWLYLQHSYEANMESEKPSEKLMDVLGHLSGNYTPRLQKPKKDKKMTPVQVARAIHQKEQIEAALKKKGGLETRSNKPVEEENDGQ